TPTRRSTRPGCEGGGCTGRRFVSARFAPGRCSYNRTTTHPRPVGAPAPGAKGGCMGRGLCSPGSHRGGAPTTKPNPTPTRRRTRPGCEGGLEWDVVCARPVRTVGGAPTTEPNPPPDPQEHPPRVRRRRALHKEGLAVAFGVVGLPAPGVGAHGFEAEFGAPAEFFGGEGGVGVAAGDIARAAVGEDVGKFVAAGFLERVQHVQHRVALAGTQVE